METFITKEAASSKLFVEVRVFYKKLARTWVIKEESNSETPKKETLKDSIPGDGNIPFFEAGKTSIFKDLNKIVAVTYLDVSKITDVDKFMTDLDIEYQIVEDDDIPGGYFENKTFKCKKSEMLLSQNKTILLITKVIEIK